MRSGVGSGPSANCRNGTKNGTSPSRAAVRASHRRNVVFPAPADPRSRTRPASSNAVAAPTPAPVKASSSRPPRRATARLTYDRSNECRPGPRPRATPNSSKELVVRMT
ncbi:MULTISPECIES: hypothetical protein [unclassified Saccharothrix]|uniref:hypothetical protein n=1 Tax=unclassified Saccharothrix TaxID=2593673 RepID=UPI00307E9CC0